MEVEEGDDELTCGTSQNYLTPQSEHCNSGGDKRGRERGKG